MDASPAYAKGKLWPGSYGKVMAELAKAEPSPQPRKGD